MGDESDNKEATGAEDSKDGGKKAGKGGVDRSASAKAFYRAMYAGAEPDPEDFGMSVRGEERTGPCPTCARLQAEVTELEKRTQEAENHYKRLLADFENYRKRIAREKDEFAAVGMQRAVEAILPALDDMDMAKTRLKPDMTSAAMMDSLTMVYNRFNRCLEQIGIKQLEVIGEMFDPVYHEPVQQIPTKAVADGAVYQQLRPGYMFGEKVLRPTLVNVATADGAPDIDEEPILPASAAAVATEEKAGDVSVVDDGGWDQEENTESRTQDLPVVDVTADLNAKLFEEKEEVEEVESAKEE
ncbi:MAG: nucleotide exchange factor GrpE [Candidatus Melainabacteria bacterium]|nr:nucleotide exchange factor GrpE [Candidatus Melainabacteria bacterium]